MAVPAGRVSLAFDSPTLTWSPTWTHLDDPDLNLVAGWTIDRGRQYELDRTDGGRATVQINDVDGILDPTNVGGPFFGQIEPLVQARIRSWDPVEEAFETRFRGWVADWDYDFDPSQQVNRLTLELVDIFDILGAIEMLPYPKFGDDPLSATPARPDAEGQVWFDAAGTAGARVEQVLADCLVPDNFAVVFSLNVSLVPSTYSVGESPMTVIQESADAEFPGLSNAYTDRFGRLAVHGRLAKWDVAGVLAGLGDPTDWDWHHWRAGDRAAVLDDLGAVAQLRRFGVNRGVSKIINSALATPQWVRSGSEYLPVDDDQIALQSVDDSTSIAQYGYRSWSAQGLQTDEGLIDSSTALEETRRFAEYYVANYSLPRNRAAPVGFRTIRPGTSGAGVTWHLLTRCDVSDRIDLTVGSPGGGGLTDEAYYIEGIHEEVKPLNPDYDDITLSLDLSPLAYFNDTTMFPGP